jgi:8-amino-3,8-dideoxy-alpha-D-manno-octulosonate transaminase
MPGYEVIGKEERDAVCNIFDIGGVLCRYGSNQKRQNIFRVDDFEREFAKKFQVKHALGISSGTGALKTVLMTLGVE